MPRSPFTRKGVFKTSKSRQDARGPKTASIVILTIVGFLAGSLWLATITDVPEVTRAGGELRPLGGYQQIQSSEGGVVFDVLVTEGQSVKKGDRLATLHSTPLEDAARDARERLRATSVEHRNLTSVLAAVTDGEASLTHAVEQMQRAGLSYGASRLRVFVARQEVQRDIAAELQHTLQVQQQASALTRQRTKARALQVARAEQLQSKQLITLNALDAQKDSLDQLRAAQVDVDVELSKTRKDLNDAQAALHQARLDLEAQLIAEIFQLETDTEAFEVQLAALADRKRSLDVRASEDGIIQAVAFPNPGEVIAAGETIFELLPTRARLVAEIEFDPVDIGHLGVGDAVTLKLDTFDARRFGYVTGVISAISPSLVVDPETAREFFRATVALDQTKIGSGQWERRLHAGMIVTAEIVTAERTALAYLMKPVARSLETAFGER
ncbi:MAG: HlyD family type I secretion periplasmic adaptor subunit [Pseudomonadota bacterium]